MQIKHLLLGGSLLLLFSPVFAQDSEGSQDLSPLTVEKIMRDPKWIGSSPNRVTWSEDGRDVYFYWNPGKANGDSLYIVSKNGGLPKKVTLSERQNLLTGTGAYNRDRTLKTVEKDGDIFLFDIRKGLPFRIFDTVERESNPRFTGDEQKISFIRDNNLYTWCLEDGRTVQKTDFRKGEEAPARKKPGTDQEKWMGDEELELIRVLKERKDRREQSRQNREAEEPRRPKPIYMKDDRVQNVRLSHDEKFITFVLAHRAKNAKRTVVPNYVTETGFTEDIQARTKVGSPQETYRFGIVDVVRDTVFFISTDQIPGIKDKPKTLSQDDVLEAGIEQTPAGGKKSERAKRLESGNREVMFNGPIWSGDRKNAVLILYALDHKDRWICKLEPDSGQLVMLDRQHDEAWIGGPGVISWRRSTNFGWMPDHRRVWFQSEETGYSHLYTVDVKTLHKRALTEGSFEVYEPRISRDKKDWYFTSNEVHPGERHFYRMALDGGERIRITRMTGRHQVFLSPDEKMLAIRHSASNRPWELYIMPNKSGAEPRRITESISKQFLSYRWRNPEIIIFTARDGADVYARLYRPEHPETKGPAVIFVHGAGYLQNAHKWWSSYFREYMFHNLLVDQGYTVLDIDYRGSAGYGHDWRTAIYRHMGGKDLSDQVDGARFLTDRYGVDPGRIGIYGGSYGGFITLMALFTEPEVFKAGAALRPVTDWAHYNHWYTSNILNIPYADTLAYNRSSPIYHAEGLKGALLMCHGMVDTNVHFQDVVRLAQRLIELGKENWELAVYPVEGHGFREPSSWTDEYKRIFKLFETHLK